MPQSLRGADSVVWTRLFSHNNDSKVGLSAALRLGSCDCLMRPFSHIHLVQPPTQAMISYVHH
jgi:hypothetical protein